jgi:uncharacterized protein
VIQPLAPGVYFQEVSSGPKPIQAVGTSTAGFVGVAPDPRARVNEAVPIGGFREFARVFAEGAKQGTPLSHAVAGFFENGGRRCYVVNVGSGGSLVGTPRAPGGLDVLAQIDEVAIVAAPGFTEPADYDAVLSHCESLEDRIAVLDAPRQVDDLDRLLEVATPASRPRRSGAGEGEDGGEGAEGASGRPAAGGGLRPRQSDRGFGAYYFPWLVVRDPFDPRSTIEVPPSGSIAGIYARTDASRGVHKAPANEAVRGALDLTRRVTQAEQAKLNDGGVNCIRIFSREGIRVWGARTLAPGASEWRYVPVRRLFSMVEESIAGSTTWVVFEPNDEVLWKAICRDVGAFLTRLWRDGALMGRTPSEAFYVKCDAETNPPEVIDAGQVVTEIGIAPVKPAEFIIFKIGQHQAGTTTTEGGNA